MTIWRDDDISVRTTVAQLAAVDDLFQAVGAPHTVAIIAKDFDRARDLIAFIKERHIIPQLHCWTHDDLTNTPVAARSLLQGVKVLEYVFGVRPTVLYPPWNRSSAKLEEYVSAFGLQVSAEKVSLDQYLRCEGDVAEPVNFHYWSAKEVALLPAALHLWREHENHRLRPESGAL